MVEAINVGSSVLVLLEAGGKSVGRLEDVDGVICLRPSENLGLLFDQRRQHHRQNGFTFLLGHLVRAFCIRRILRQYCI